MSASQGDAPNGTGVLIPFWRAITVNAPNGFSSQTITGYPDNVTATWSRAIVPPNSTYTTQVTVVPPMLAVIVQIPDSALSISPAGTWTFGVDYSADKGATSPTTRLIGYQGGFSISNGVLIGGTITDSNGNPIGGGTNPGGDNSGGTGGGTGGGNNSGGGTIWTTAPFCTGTTYTSGGTCAGTIWTPGKCG